MNKEIIKFWFGDSNEYSYRGSLWWHSILPKELRGNNNDQNKEKLQIETDNYIKQKWEKYLNDTYNTYKKDNFNINYDGKLESIETLISHIILFDQFPRHIYRGTKDAFKYDKIASKISLLLLDNEKLFNSYFHVITRTGIDLPLAEYLADVYC